MVELEWTWCSKSLPVPEETEKTCLHLSQKTEKSGFQVKMQKKGH